MAAASRSVVRVVTVATIAGRIVGHGHGSGFAISRTHIVTNAHVVELAARFPDNVEIGVVPSEGTKAYAAKIVAIDEKRDLALIEMVAGSIEPAALFSGPVPSGTKVSALGYPGNVDAAVERGLFDQIKPRKPLRSDGNASSLEEVNGTSVLSHTAPIARGNSGGPLVDGCGRVVGVNTFITRGDDGDSTFGFATEVPVLARFLATAGQAPRTVATECTPAEVAEDKARAALAAEEAEAARLRAEEAEADRKTREKRLLDTIAVRENHLAIAALLLVLAGMAAGGAWLARMGQQRKPMLWLGWASAALAIASVMTFLTRPSFENALAAPAAPEAEAKSTGKAAEAPAEAEEKPTAPAVPAAQALTCIIDMDASRVTISKTTDVPISIDDKGCVNARAGKPGTQYADVGDGSWERVLVPNETAEVSVVLFNPAKASYTVERFLPDAEKMAEARKLRASVPIKACSADADAVLKLGDAQAAIRAILPKSPNERLVYKCSAAK